MTLTIIIIAILIFIYLFSKVRFSKKEIIAKYDLNSDKEKFREEFLKIINDNPNLNYLVIDFSSYYIQYMGWANSSELFCEAMSNEFIEESKKLTTNQIDKINKLGFKEPFIDSDKNKSPNYSKYYKTDSDRNIELIFEEMIYLITDIYNSKNIDINIRYV